MRRKTYHVTRKMVRGWVKPGLVLLTFISRLTSFAYAMSNRRHGDYIERPMHITAPPQKRDATICPTSYSLCPTSLGGGCCPTDASCGTSSCYPTTAAGPVQCSAFPGYFACGIDQGGMSSSSWLSFVTDRYSWLLPERFYMRQSQRLYRSSRLDREPKLRHFLIHVPHVVRNICLLS